MQRKPVPGQCISELHKRSGGSVFKHQRGLLALELSIFFLTGEAVATGGGTSEDREEESRIKTVLLQDA